jgi:hypothetical protein
MSGGVLRAGAAEGEALPLRYLESSRKGTKGESTHGVTADVHVF